MKLLLVNPNVTGAIAEVMAAEARRSASPGTEIEVALAGFGTLYIENRVEAAIAAHAVLDVLAEKGAGCHAAIVAAFGDPGVFAAKELMEIPVVGVSEAAFLFAYTQGKRYSIVCLTERLRAWYMECAEEHGLSGRMASARAIPVAVPDITTAKADLVAELTEQCRLAVEQDGAEVVILGGGPTAGLAREIADRVPVPLIDPVACAVKLAESLVNLELRPPEKGSFARPSPKPARGLSPALAKLIDRG
ncbi:MAG: aspartate/glutamate racemase family protein [Paracoccaceae bacterium]|nr:aspartate/glutamate racemase family protein [Paracoccaceae bacterium]